MKRRPFEISVRQRQREVLDLIARGHTNGEIAERLGISLGGVKWHVSELMSKAGVDSRDELGDLWEQRNSLSGRTSALFRALVGIASPRILIASGAAVAVGILVLAAIATVIVRPTEEEPASLALVPASRLSITDAEQVARRYLDDEFSLAGTGGEFTVAGRRITAVEFSRVEADYLPSASVLTLPNNVGDSAIGPGPRDLWRFLFVAYVDQPASTPAINAFVVLDDATGQPFRLDIFGDLAGFDGSLGRLSEPLYLGTAFSDSVEFSMSLWKSAFGWCVDLADSRFASARPGDMSRCPFSFADMRSGAPILGLEQGNAGHEVALALVAPGTASVRFTTEDGRVFTAVPSGIVPGFDPPMAVAIAAYPASNTVLLIETLDPGGTVLHSLIVRDRILD
ncbi:MAG: helix-turn-helix domain-containing protein [Tepidiformaceae bacterium]